MDGRGTSQAFMRMRSEGYSSLYVCVCPVSPSVSQRLTSRIGNRA